MTAVATASSASAACQLLHATLEPSEWTSDPIECAAYASDVYAAGSAAAVVRCRDRERLARAIAALGRAGVPIVPRGGGMSYTKGYVPTRSDGVVIDTAVLDRIVEVNRQDMYITVEAGVTWKTIDETLRPLGLRLPFFGTFSGAKATVGGGLSNGALFFGTARYGTAADCLLGLEVILADGTRLRTGQGAQRAGRKPFYRTYGPDLSGLFTHDCGALGVKVEATFRLIEAPAHTAYGSFAFDHLPAAARALSAVARSGAAEEAYVFDPASTQKNLAASTLKSDLRVLANVVRQERSWLDGLRAGARLALAGRRFLDANAYSLHVVTTGRTRAAAQAD
ncbi:MAG: FAD-binding oxidoreductase, partial [Steroidobacteraceae bacterium]|nr:FAD-binding oxidoreductase [Steroidobacteraceae bacterium]MDW8259707.1 FAD-binding oxidoreductase [Gammaproteobacteria bacterium]